LSPLKRLQETREGELTRDLLKERWGFDLI
jgi:hypothetical protein